MPRDLAVATWSARRVPVAAAGTVGLTCAYSVANYIRRQYDGFLPSISESALAPGSTIPYAVGFAAAAALVLATVVLYFMAVGRELRTPAAGTLLLLCGAAVSAGMAVQGAVPIDLTRSADAHRTAAAALFLGGFVLCGFAAAHTWRREAACARRALKLLRAGIFAGLVALLAAVPLAARGVGSVVSLSVTDMLDNPELHTRFALIQYAFVALLLALLLSFSHEAARVQVVLEVGE